MRKLLTLRTILGRRDLIRGGVLLSLTGLAGGVEARSRISDEAMIFTHPGIPAGTIIISQSRRRLYLTRTDGSAISWPIAVGKSGKGWTGWARVDGKHVMPAWSPPASVKRDRPGLPSVIAGGAPNNPMGARALTLDREEIAIHGTTAAMRSSIGTAASYGCIRMLNEDVIDLFNQVQVGTRVLSVS